MFMIPQKQSLQGYHCPFQAAAMHFAERIALDIQYHNCFTVMIPQKQSLQLLYHCWQENQGACTQPRPHKKQPLHWERLLGFISLFICLLPQPQQRRLP